MLFRSRSGLERLAGEEQPLGLTLVVPVRGEFKITQRLECGTTLDSVSASDTNRGLLVIQIRRPSVLAGVLPAPRGSGGH